MNWFLTSNTAAAKLARTLAELILGWILAYLPDILGLFTLDPAIRGLLASFITMLITGILGSVNDNRNEVK